MSDKYPNPWNFSNSDKNLLSPNGKYKIEFRDLNEIAMGAPLGGACYLIDNGEKLKLNDWCGGPIIWSETSDKLALPIWTKQRNQKIAIVDIKERTLTIYKEEFRVLHFNKFSKNTLSAMDSPVYKSKKINFDVDQEEIDTIKRFK